MGIKGTKTNHPMSVKNPKNRRRISALRLLTTQLSSGVKPVKGSLVDKTELTDSDKQRINHTINILKERIKV